MSHRILVVDDEPDITALVAYHLAKAGYRWDSEAGLRILEAGWPILAEGRVIGDTTTLADPSVLASIKEQYENAE